MIKEQRRNSKTQEENAYLFKPTQNVESSERLTHK